MFWTSRDTTETERLPTCRTSERRRLTVKMYASAVMG